VTPPVPDRRADDQSVLAVVVSRIDQLSGQITDLVRSLEVNYVRKEVNDARFDLMLVQVKNIARDLADLRKDADVMAEQRRQDRRIWLPGLVFPLLTVIFGFYLTQAGVHP
jgi:hypothetical protein